MKIDTGEREFQPFILTITFETAREARAFADALTLGNKDGSSTLHEVVETVNAHLPPLSRLDRAVADARDDGMLR